MCAPVSEAPDRSVHPRAFVSRGSSTPRYSVGTAYTRVADPYRTRYVRSPPARVFELVSELFFDDVLEHLVLKSHVSVHTLELGQFCLEFSETPELAGLHARILLAPVVEGLLGDAVFAADVDDLAARFSFGNNADDLVVSEGRFFHDSLK